MANTTSSASVNEVTIIGKGMEIQGMLQVSGDMRVGGKIVGSINVDGKMIMSKGGVIEGDVETKNAEIAHKVRGNLLITEHLILRNTAEIDGDIKAKRMTVDEGAMVTGTCKVGTS